jgi:hypothetical protein
MTRTAWQRFREIGPSTATLALALWAVWWTVALIELDLPVAGWTTFIPAFGADFTSQTDHAARTWSGYADPYADHRHLFHYPPIVIRLFAWTPYFSTTTALRIWVVVLALLVIAGAVLAWKTRRELGVEEVPLAFALACVLFSAPVVFALERANFDLITLAAILLALRVERRGGNFAEVAAGCLLAVGPWVKIYPGLIGVALFALRRFRMLAGFVGGGIAIGLAAPAETLRSFEVLRLAMERTRQGTPLGAWAHSVSIAWLEIVHHAKLSGFGALAKVPSSLVAAAAVTPALFWVSLRVYQCEKRGLLTYPLLLWVVALASFVPEIANDYSLVFLPVAAVAVYSRREPWIVHAGMALLLVVLQPFALPINPFVLLLFKLVGLYAVGAMLVQRANELGGAAPARGQGAALPAQGASSAAGGSTAGGSAVVGDEVVALAADGGGLAALDVFERDPRTRAAAAGGRQDESRRGRAVRATGVLAPRQQSLARADHDRHQRRT